MVLKELPSLLHLLKVLQQVPYLASKNGYRVADYFLEQDEQQLQQFCNALMQAKQNIVHCSVCFGWQERLKACIFCASTTRDKSIICVVESWQELMIIEKTGNYNGLYHVLGGLISPLEGVHAADLTIDALIQRVSSDVQEIIFALNQTPEGEATMHFVTRKLHEKMVKLSCLARGLPVGSALESMDRLTVYKALSERRSLIP